MLKRLTDHERSVLWTDIRRTRELWWIGRYQAEDAENATGLFACWTFAGRFAGRFHIRDDRSNSTDPVEILGFIRVPTFVLDEAVVVTSPQTIETLTQGLTRNLKGVRKRGWR